MVITSLEQFLTRIQTVYFSFVFGEILIVTFQKYICRNSSKYTLALLGKLSIAGVS